MRRPASGPKDGVHLTATEWTFTFSDPYRVSARSSRGESYGGEALIRWDLGADKTGMRVPPGWGPLDVEINESSWPEAVGKVALAAFTVSESELKLCGGPPGSTVRVTSFESPGPEFRCMVLARSEDGEAEDEEEDAAPESPGEATFLLDGAARRYPLKTDVFSDTRLGRPEHALLHFELPAPRPSNAERILIQLDATQTGRHHADGQAIHDMNFNDKPVSVGQLTDGARAAVFKWIADGGQHYAPKIGTGCDITVTSRYTGQEDGVFTAEMSDCVVHSAGIDHTVSGLKLRIIGAIER